MAENQNKVTSILIIRNDFTQAWESSEYLLKKGELALEYTATGKVKIKAGASTGDKKWSELPYIGGDETIVYQGAAVSTTDSRTDVAIIESYVNGAELHNGDMAIVKRAIVDAAEGETPDKVAHTAYVYDGEKWAAMDGNYRADNVYFDSDLTYTASVGALKLASGKNSDVYAAKGQSLETVIRRIMAETIPPSITQPSYTLTGVSYTADTSNEVGSKITALTWNGTYSDGSYSYGRSSTANGGAGNVSTTKAAGCSATYSMECDQAGSTKDGAKVDGTYTLTTPFQITSTSEATVGKITTTCVIGDAAYWPINNINEVVDGKITGKTVTKEGTVKVTGYRGWFCGWKNGTDALADPTAITSDQVRALTKANGSWSSSMNVSQMKQMFFLAPAGAGYKPVIKDSKTDAPQTVEGPVTVYVKGANNYMAAGTETTNGGMAYDMWYVNNAAAASGSATLNITK